MRKSLLIPMALLLSAVVVLSCEKDSSRNVNPGRNTGINMVADVIDAAEYIETKSGAIAQLKNVYGEPGDDFIITEYVTDIAAALPQTKGTEIKTGNIDSKYGKFHTTAFLEDTVNFSLNHKLPVSGGWEGTAPKWVSRMTYDIWSYAPATMDSEETNFNVSSDALTFTHSVPKALEAQKDLVFAHNEETRNFYDPESKSFVPDPSKPEKDPNIKVKFYHALSAVKFVLDVTDTQTAAAADVHSITLCYIDPDTHQIVTSNAGIATTGDCTVTGGAGTASFSWGNYDDIKPLHYVFNDTYPRTSSCVANGYCNTGDGVMFMIPQNIEDIYVIVEFSKYGGDKFYTVFKKLTNVEWQAGKFYTYKLQIGEFHVPGELLVNLGHIEFKGLMHAGAEGEIMPATPFSTLKVTKVGMVLDKYGLGVDEDTQVMIIYGVPNGNDAYAGKSAATIMTYDNPTFSFNFADVTADPNSGGKLFNFGTGGTETYNSLFYRFSKTQAKSKTPTEVKQNEAGQPSSTGTKPWYYAFDTTDADSFQVMFKAIADDNSCGFAASPTCVIALEVEKDPNFPSNFSTIDWDNI